jgi:excisionase family DNA binding protein
MTDQGEFLTASDLAKMANVDFSYICRLCRTGRIPAIKHGPAWLIRREDALAWLASRRARKVRRRKL